MEQKFKVGDRVTVKDKFEGYDLKGMSGEIIKIKDSGSIGVDFDKSFNSGHDCDGLSKQSNGRWGPAEDLELTKKYKPKTPTHLVIWEVAGCGDPCEFFTSDSDAKDKVKELSENNSIDQSSILLVEVKSCAKVTVTKRLGYKPHTI